MQTATHQMSKWMRLKRFSRECYRVMLVIKKPNRSEFATVSKMSALGMAVIGIIGFILFFIKQLLF